MRSGQPQFSAVRASLLPAVLRAVGGCAALCIAAQAFGADSARDDPRDWLARTDEALSNRNYEGVFVHEHAGETETLRVIHRVDGEGVAERLQSMDGSGREFIRKGNQLICYLPDRHTVLVERSPDAALLLSGLPRMDAGSDGQYEIKELARTRVSGRDARVIAIAPLDQLRYGYRVWIDEGTAMPLKTQLRDSHGGVLEQIVFTSLNMLARIPNSELEPGIDAHAYRWVRRDAEPIDSGTLSVSWESAALPAGFRMTASARQMLPAGPVEHLVFSDGLASVSVFVEIGRSGDGSASAGAAREDAAALGASSAYSLVVQGYRVTAVGEVPPETVRVIAQAIRNAGPSAAAPDTAPSAATAATAPPGAPVFLPRSHDGFDGPPASGAFATDVIAPTSPTLHSFGADRPVFGAASAPGAFGPAAGPPAGGSGRR
jgi:sigma-E factor negative regulatory protein RseB